MMMMSMLSMLLLFLFDVPYREQFGAPRDVHQFVAVGLLSLMMVLMGQVVLWDMSHFESKSQDN